MTKDLYEVPESDVRATLGRLAQMARGYLPVFSVSVSRDGDNVTAQSSGDVPEIWVGRADVWADAVKRASPPPTAEEVEREEIRQAVRKRREGILWALVLLTRQQGFVQTDPLKYWGVEKPPTLEIHEIFDCSGDADRPDQFMIDLSRGHQRLRVFVGNEVEGRNVLLDAAAKPAEPPRGVHGVQWEHPFVALATRHNGNTWDRRYNR